MTLDYGALDAYIAQYDAADSFRNLVEESKLFYGAWELDVLKWFYDAHNAFLDFIMPKITLLGDGGIFWMILTVILLIIPKTRKVGIASFFALLFDVILCNGVAKPIAMRCRPGWLMFYEEGPGWIRQMLPQMLVKFPNDYSFPSGHTAFSFAGATSIFATLKGKQKWWGVAALVLATLIGISRLYVVVHWPTDVICGCLLGIICGILGWAICQPIWRWIEKKRAERAANKA